MRNKKGVYLKYEVYGYPFCGMKVTVLNPVTYGFSAHFFCLNWRNKLMLKFIFI